MRAMGLSRYSRSSLFLCCDYSDWILGEIILWMPCGPTIVMTARTRRTMVMGVTETDMDSSGE